MKTKIFKLMILINSLEDICGGLYSCTPVVYFSLSKLIQGVFRDVPLLKLQKLSASIRVVVVESLMVIWQACKLQSSALVMLKTKAAVHRCSPK